jgi:hypothetical protein
MNLLDLVSFGMWELRHHPLLHIFDGVCFHNPPNTAVWIANFKGFDK